MAEAKPPDPRVIAAVAPVVRGARSLVTPSAAVADALRTDVEVEVATSSLEAPGASGCGGVLLLHDELSAAGEHAEGMLAQVVQTVRPGGLVAVAVRSSAGRHDSPQTLRGFRADELVRALGHHGITVELLCAPGAAGVAAGTPDAPYDPELDRLPGLLDAGPRVVAVGRTSTSPEQRSTVFFTTLPRKVLAAAVLCRDTAGRLLIVHDSFKGHWTLPGGVVDADEDPRSAAAREAWEEAGVRVHVGSVLGVFSASWPDRVALVYEASPADDVTDPPRPLHTHEIDAAAWVPLDDALHRLAPPIAEQVRHCLDDPGGTLHQRWP